MTICLWEHPLHSPSYKRVSSETADPSFPLCEADAYALPSLLSWTARPLQGAGLCWKFTASPHLCFLNGATGSTRCGTADKDNDFAGKNIQATASLRVLLQPLCPQVPP